jgi:hypothetical protein
VGTGTVRAAVELVAMLGEINRPIGEQAGRFLEDFFKKYI